MKLNAIRSKYILSLLIAALGAMYSFKGAADSYPKHLTFLNIMEGKDVALGEVEAITQDSDGFVWFGGRNALLRYDGYEFKAIEIVEEVDGQVRSVVFSQITDIIEDKQKQLWIASRSGLLLYDKNLEIARRIHPSDGKDLQIYKDTVNRIAISPAGTLLAGAFAGLNLINTKTKNGVLLANNPDDPSTLGNNVVHDIFVDNDKRVWLGTDSGISLFDEENRTFKNFVPYPEMPNSLPDNAIWAIDQDLSGDLWLGTRKGIYRFSPNSNEFTRFLNDPNDVKSLPDNIIMDIFVDHKGWVWVGTDTKGVSIFNPDLGGFIRYSEENYMGALSASSVRRFYEDVKGDMWVGTYPSGVNFHDRSTTAISWYSVSGDTSNSISSNTVTSMLEDSSGNFWIGTGDSVDYFNRDSGEFSNYNSSTNNGDAVSMNAIISGDIDGKGTVWFGTWANSFHKYIPEDDRFEQIDFDASLSGLKNKIAKALPDSVVWHIYADSFNELWLGLHHGGLAKYNQETKLFTRYISDPDDLNTLSNQLVWTVYEDTKGQLWVGTARGLNLFDRESGNFKQFLPDDEDPNSLLNASVLSIFEDSSGRLWAGTDGGLHLFNPETEGFKAYTVEDGFVDNGIRSIIEDRNGNLWLGTNNGIVMFNPDSKSVKNYKQHNGRLFGGMNTGAVSISSKGEIMFGGNTGMIIIDPDKLGVNKTPPPVVFTDFKIFTKTVAINGSENILRGAVNQVEEIVLDHEKTMYSFYFSALNYRNPEKNQYAYKLEGFDDDWREVGSLRKAQYTNLSAGTYVFRVKASNNDGIWNDEGKSIRIIQLPPPWKTWWAYTIYVLILLAIVFNFIRSQQRKRKMVEEQNRILELKVAERTADLAKKNNDIQAMLGNMRQGLFTMEPPGIIHSEYSKHLEDIFETTDITGKNAYEFLFSSAELGSNELNQVKEAILSMLGEDVMNFGFNSHLLIYEYKAVINDKEKYLSLDWNPILDGDIVEKVMVSIRDVTQLKQMESEAANKKRELDIISQLINVSAKKYKGFIDSSNNFISENKRYIQETNHKDESVIALLFRNMHTIKGNCRTFGFKILSDIVHDVETVYSQMNSSNNDEWDQEKLLSDLNLVEACIGEYQNVYLNVLGRGDAGSSRDQNGFWLDSASIKTLSTSIDSALKKHQDLSDVLNPVYGVLDRGLSVPFSSVLTDIISSLGSIAEQLGKKPPSVVIDDKQIRVLEDGQELLCNLFAHILRNSLDHGIEAPSQRLAAGKPEEGNISVDLNPRSEVIEIVVKDDGRGLNIKHLYQKGLDSKKWEVGDSIRLDRISQLIFLSGVSTKTEITDISGRGVGMDAVKAFLIDVGGSITVKIEETQEHTLYSASDALEFVPFSLVITMPLAFFSLVDLN